MIPYKHLDKRVVDMKCFLSHSSDDKDNYVRPIAEYLGKNKCVYDEYSFEEGEEILDAILSGLDSSQLFVFFISDTSLNKPWVIKELKYASELFHKSQENKILPIIIDEKIKFDDKRLPSWLVKNYNIQYIKKPIKAAKRIHQKIIELSWKSFPKIEARNNIFSGRLNEVGEIENRFNDVIRPYPFCLVVSGMTYVGRKRIMRESLIKCRSIERSHVPSEITLTDSDNIEEFIRKIHNLGYNEDVGITLDLMDKEYSKKLETAIRLLCEFFENEKILFIDDKYCLVGKNRRFHQWFEEILNATYKKVSELDVYICVASNYAVDYFHYKDMVFSLQVSSLSVSDRNGLLKRCLEIEEVPVSKEEYRLILPLLSGLPEQIFYIVNLIKTGRVDAVRDQYDSIADFSSQRALLAIQSFQSKQAAMDLLVILSEEEVCSITFLKELFYDGDIPFLEEFLVMGICEYIHNGSGYIRLNDIIRDYLNRNRFKNKLSEKYKTLIRRKTVEFFKAGNLEDADLFEINFHTKEAMKNNLNFDVRYLLPSHYLRTMQELYRDSKYRELIKYADILLEKELTLDNLTIKYARNFLCRALAKLQLPRFKTEVCKVEQPDHDFLFGFYYRKISKFENAIERYKNVIGTKLDKMAKGELVLIYRYLGEFSQALSLAEENYKEDKTNRFYIQAYAECLINEDIQNNNHLIEKLICELVDSPSELANEMGLILKAQYSLHMGNDVEKANSFLNAANKINPNSKYVKIEMIKLYLIAGKYKDAADLVSELEKQIGNDALPKTSMIKFKAELLSKKGKKAEARRLLESELHNIPQSSLSGLIEKICK